MISRTHKTIKSALTVAVVLTISQGISGCIVTLPTSVQVASLAFDGISFLATGKTVGDHALSAATDQDCAMSRALSGKTICNDEVELSDWSVIESRLNTANTARGSKAAPPDMTVARPTLEMILSNQAEILEDDLKDLPDMDVAQGPKP